MVVLGITGGAGCGKSTVLDYLKKQYDALLIQADEIGREMQMPGGRAYAAMCDLIGPEYIDEDGLIRRAALAARMYKDNGLKDRINALIHPLVAERIINLIEAQYASDEDSLVVVEAALLFEGELDILCDEVWYIYAPEAVRRSRLKETRGYSDEMITAMMQAQHSDAEFRDLCDATINNGNDLQKTYRQIRALLG